MLRDSVLCDFYQNSGVGNHTKKTYTLTLPSQFVSVHGNLITGETEILIVAATAVENTIQLQRNSVFLQ